MSRSRACGNGQTRKYRRRRYRELLASGLAPAEARARMRGQTPERVRADWIKWARAYRAQWGGEPHSNAQAWRRRVLAEHGAVI